MKIFMLLVTFLAVPCLIAADRETEYYFIDNFDGSFDGRGVYLTDGDLLVYFGISNNANHAAKPIEAEANTFDIQRTAEGTLIVLWPKARGTSRQTDKTLKLDGYYLTADYSDSVPSIKLTKKLSKNSYWEVPEDRKYGYFVSKDDHGKPVYLGVDKSPILFGDKYSDAIMEHRKLTLSYEPKEKFRITKWDPKDDGK